MPAPGAVDWFSTENQQPSTTPFFVEMEKTKNTHL